jgi:hypothetical protein
MSGGNAVRGSAGGRGIAHPKGGAAVLHSGLEPGERWGYPPVALRVQSLTVRGGTPLEDMNSGTDGGWPVLFLAWDLPLRRARSAAGLPCARDRHPDA